MKLYKISTSLNLCLICIIGCSPKIIPTSSNIAGLYVRNPSSPPISLMAGIDYIDEYLELKKDSTFTHETFLSKDNGYDVSPTEYSSLGMGNYKISNNKLILFYQDRGLNKMRHINNVLDTYYIIDTSIVKINHRFVSDSNHPFNRISAIIHESYADTLTIKPRRNKVKINNLIKID